MKKKIDFENEMEDLGVQKLTPELDEQINAMIEQADREFEEARVNIRWQKQQLDLVKRAASIIGIPYQIYIKDIVFRKSVEDINNFSKIK